MKNRFAILITLGALLMVLIAQPACLGSGPSKPPHYGAFLKKGRSFIEMEPKGLSKPLPSDEGVPHTSDKQPLIVVWDPDVIPRFLVFSGGKFDIASKEDGVLELRPREPLSPGMYRLAAGDPLLPPGDIPRWYFVVEGTAAEADDARQGVMATATAEFLAPTTTAEAISAQATVAAEATGQAALTVYDPPKPGLYAVNQQWQRSGGSKPYVARFETVQVLDEGTMRLHLRFWSNGNSSYSIIERSQIIYEDGTVLGAINSGGELANLDGPVEDAEGFVDFPLVRNSEMAWILQYSGSSPELRFKDFTPVAGMPQATGVAIAAENAKATATAEAIAAERAAVTATREAWEASLIASCPMRLIAPETSVSSPNTHMELAKIEVSRSGQTRLYLTIVVEWGGPTVISRPDDIYLWQGGQTYSAIAFEGFFEELREGLHELRFDGGEGTRVSGTISFPSVPDASTPFEFHYGKYYTFVNIPPNEDLILIQTYLSEGETYLDENDLEHAEEAYAKALELNPNTVQARFWLAYIYGKQGKLQEAVQENLKVLEKLPSHYSAHVSLIFLYQELGRIHEAVAEAQIVLGLVTVSAAKGGWEAEIARLRWRLDQPIGSSDEESILTYLSEGQTYLNEDDLEHAEEAFEKALELNPNIMQAREALASLYVQQGKLQEALKENLRILELAPHYFATHKNLAMIYQQLGRIEEAIAEAETALEFAPPGNKPELEALIAQLREQIGP